MNYSASVFLINEHVRAVACIYEDATENPNQKRWTYKTLDATIQVGDLVVVPTGTRHKMTIAKVVEVDSDVDFNSDIQYKWIVQRVDQEPYNTTLKQEAEAMVVVKSADQRRHRDELRAAMIKDNEARYKALALFDQKKPDDRKDAPRRGLKCKQFRTVMPQSSEAWRSLRVCRPTYSSVMILAAVGVIQAADQAIAIGRRG